MVKPIAASGGLVVRSSDDGARVLVVHRPRYDDWTFPKGKDEIGEDSVEAALREVREESGQDPRLIGLVGETSYPVDGTTKVVRWYGMRVAKPVPFTPNDEVDEIRWLDPDEAPDLLSYDHDRDVLERVDLDSLLTTGTLFLVRHGSAGDRRSWTGEDRLRPLSSRGERQAAGLAATLTDRTVEAIYTSPYLRCVQTVRPLADAIGLVAIEHPALAEGGGGKATRELVRELAGTNAVLCSHGDVIPATLDWMMHKGLTLRSDFDCKKGSTWEVAVRAGTFHKARYLPPVESPA
jgi:broad specificity phosphatase PhoE/8-oxo-dGTP pyrophosphatase MutT (NUDIX family)